MCDIIIMPDETEVESINKDDSCLCCNSQTEILSWIINRIPIIDRGKRLVIEHQPFGWQCYIIVLDVPKIIERQECFGKFKEDDVYCKECEVSVECYEDTAGSDRHDA